MMRAPPASPCPDNSFTSVGKTGMITPIDIVFIRMAA